MRQCILYLKGYSITQFLQAWGQHASCDLLVSVDCKNCKRVKISLCLWWAQISTVTQTEITFSFLHLPWLPIDLHVWHRHIAPYPSCRLSATSAPKEHSNMTTACWRKILTVAILKKYKQYPVVHIKINFMLMTYRFLKAFRWRAWISKYMHFFPLPWSPICMSAQGK